MNWSEAPQLLRLVQGSSMQHWAPWLERKVAAGAKRSDLAAHRTAERSERKRAAIRQACGALKPEVPATFVGVKFRLTRDPQRYGVDAPPEDELIRDELALMAGVQRPKRTRPAEMAPTSISKPAPAVWFAAYAATQAST